MGRMLCCKRMRSPSDVQEALLRRERRRIHDQIEKDLRADEKRRKREHRILLLGCGEAGKSTFIKQMRIIHSDGFNKEERLNIKEDIAVNIIVAIQTLLQNIKGDLGELEEDARKIEDLSPRIKSLDLLPHVSLIHSLWQTPEVQEAYENRARFQLVECAKYFLSRAETVLQPDYLPTNQDIVQTRVKTTGIIEHDFEILYQGTSKRKLVLIDVGGQRSERRKWIHSFEDVTLLMFLTAISEYDQVLAEDEETNRMQESLLLFKTILNYNWFEQTNVILFLNKMDVLREKISKSPLRRHFPDFDGPEGDAEAVVQFFTKRFMDLNPNPRDRKVFVKDTCATDTENFGVVDVMVQKIIMDKVLGDAMIN